MLRRALPGLLVSCALASSSSALESVWNASSGNWSNGANWIGGIAPTAPGATDLDLRFRGSSSAGFATTNDLGAFALRTLVLQSGRGFALGTTAPSASTLTSASALSFSAPGGAIIQAGGGDVDVRAPLTLTGSVLVGGGGTGALQFSRALGGTGSLQIDRGGRWVTILGNGNSAVNSTFSGGVELVSGLLLLDEAGGLGTGALRVSGGRFGGNLFSGVRDFTVPNPVVLSGPLVIGGSSSLLLTGGISGTGSLTVEGDPFNFNLPTQIRFGAASAFNGAFVVRTGNGSTVSVNGATGAFSGVTSVAVERAATLEIDDRTAGSTVNRLPDAAPVSLAGGATLIYRSGAARVSAESIGSLRATGLGTVSLNPATSDGATSAVLTTAAFEPAPGAVIQFRGRNLGGQIPGTPGSDNVLFGNATAVQAAQIGGGGAAGTPTVSVVPQALAGSGLLNSFQFVTYDAARGLRPLVGAEISNTLVSGATALTNVRLLTTAVLDAPTRVNALALDLVLNGGSNPVAGRVSGGGSLTVESGLILMGPQNSQITVSGLAFGAQRGIITTTSFAISPLGAPSPATISSNISGTGGISILGAGTLNLTGNNQIDGGLLIGAPVVAGSAAALGGSGPIVLDGGSLSLSGGGSLGREVLVGPGGGAIPSALTLTGALHGAGELAVGTITLAGAGSTFAGVLAFDAPLRLATSGCLGPDATLRALVGTTTAALRVDVPFVLSGALEFLPTNISGSLTLDAAASFSVSGLRMTRLETSFLLGSFVKSGSAVFTVNGDVELRGSLAVQAGGWIVNGRIAAPGSATPSPLTVSAGAFFGGNAQVFRDLTLNGTLRPGAAGAGTLRIDGTLSLLPGSTYEWERSASVSDLLDLEGALAVSGGTVNVRLRALDAALPSGFDLLVRTRDGISGTLPVFVLDYTDAPAWAALGLSVQQVGTNLYLVPEPGVNALLALAALGLGALRWRGRGRG